MFVRRPESRLMKQEGGRHGGPVDGLGGKEKTPSGLDGKSHGQDFNGAAMTLANEAQNSWWIITRVITTGQSDSKQIFLPSCPLRRVNCLMGIVYSPRGGPAPLPSPVFQVSPRLLTQRQCSCWQDCARLSSHATARSWEIVSIRDRGG